MWAQTPRWSAAVPAPHITGRQAIELSPELLGVSRADLGDIRLLDSTGQEVPYVLQRAEAPMPTVATTSYPVLRNEVEGRTTVVELEAAAPGFAPQFELVMRPAEVDKKVRVLGSDDRRRWYMVQDRRSAPRLLQQDPPRQALMIATPPHDYRYLRIVLDDSLTAPINIIEAVHRGEGRTTAASRSRGTLTWQQVDSAGLTRLRVTGPHPLLLDRLRFTVSDSGDFLRTGRVVARDTMPIRYPKPRQERYALVDRPVGACVIASHRPSVIELARAERLGTFELVVDNGDDRALHFTALEGEVAKHVLLADLRAGMRYTISTGDARRTAPRYDLVHFAAEGPVPSDTLGVGGLVPAAQLAVTGPGLDPSREWIWAVIVVLMAGMGWMAVRMLRSDDRGTTP